MTTTAALLIHAMVAYAALDYTRTLQETAAQTGAHPVGVGAA